MKSDSRSTSFGTRAAIDLRVGGSRVVGQGDSLEIGGRIEEIEPLRRIRGVYTADGEETGQRRPHTRLTLVNSFADDGIEDWEGFLWRHQEGLASLPRFSETRSRRRLREVEGG